LHVHLVGYIKAMNILDLTGQYRIYVDGREVAQFPDLFDVTTGGPPVAHIPDRDDMMGAAERLQYRLVDAAAGYLTERRIDVSGFVGPSVTTINIAQQAIFNGLRTEAVAFGATLPATGGADPPATPKSRPASR
jgi:hypothetical protein